MRNFQELVVFCSTCHWFFILLLNDDGLSVWKSLDTTINSIRIVIRIQPRTRHIIQLGYNHWKIFRRLIRLICVSIAWYNHHRFRKFIKLFIWLHRCFVKRKRSVYWVPILTFLKKTSFVHFGLVIRCYFLNVILDLSFNFLELNHQISMRLIQSVVLSNKRLILLNKIINLSN